MDIRNILRKIDDQRHAHARLGNTSLVLAISEDTLAQMMREAERNHWSRVADFSGRMYFQGMRCVVATDVPVDFVEVLCAAPR